MKNTIQEQAINLIEYKTSLLKKISLAVIGLCFVSIGIFFFFEYKKGSFTNIETFQIFIQSFGWFGPFSLTLFQCVKVFYAIIPGTLGYIVGPSIFNPIIGFLCNYIGICSGSFLAFWLARSFGISFVKQIFSEKQYQRLIKKMEKRHKSYALFLWFGILIPISPDDLLCYFSGLTDMKFKKFALIILTSKPWTILAYCLIFGKIF